MAAEQSTGLSSGVDSQFMAEALVFHRLRNKAIGIEQDNQFVRGLSLAMYRAKQQETMAAWSGLLLGMVEQCKVEIKRMIGEADTPEKRREVLPAVERLQEKALWAQEQLEALSG